MDESDHSNLRYTQRRTPTTNRQPSYPVQSSRPGSSFQVRNASHSRPANYTRFNKEDDIYTDDDNDDDVDEEETYYGGRHGTGRVSVRSDFNRGGVDEEDEYGDRKRRKMKSVMEYESGGRVNGGGGGYGVVRSGGGGGFREWSENEIALLLEAWGDRYLQLGRKSLRSEDWKELAERVSEASGIERTDVECRNKMDTLKKRYRKEKAKLEQFGGQCKWVYFKKMDMLLTMPSRQQSGLACGVDSGEYVFMNPRVYLNCANGLDEMRDSPGNSEDEDEEGEEDDESGGGIEQSVSFRYLADSIKKFGEIYEKIENSKRQKMMELEKMRMDFQREMELQKKQIVDTAEAEMEKLRENDEDENGDDENVDDGDTDGTAENLSR